MNRTKIEYLDYTHNPITGCNGKGCAVRKHCWALAMSKRLRGRYGYPSKNPFEPTFHEDKLNEPLIVKKPSRIGLCFMGDFFDIDVPLRWQAEVYTMVKRAHWHTFFILTKQPQNAVNFLPNPPLKNLWLGVSVNHQKDVWRIEALKQTNVIVKAVSFEPLYEEIVCHLKGIDWIIIGAQTRPNLQPKTEWVYSLSHKASELGIPVFWKNNLKCVHGSRQEFPKL